MYGISALLLVCAGALVALRLRARPAHARSWRSSCCVLPGWRGLRCTAAPGRTRSGRRSAVAIVQGAIPQDEKWQESNRETTLRIYQTLTEQVLGTELIVWPEAAPADTANDLADYLSNLYREARGRGSALVLGVLREEGSLEHPDEQHYYNSVLALSRPGELVRQAPPGAVRRSSSRCRSSCAAGCAS